MLAILNSGLAAEGGVVSKRLRIVAAATLCVLVAAAVLVTLVVETEVADEREIVGGAGPARAVVLYHPSRDAHFSDDLSQTIAATLAAAGYSVERATLTHATPASWPGVTLLVVVSNTYWWTPDVPTLRYLARARLRGIAAVGIIGGAGSTDRSRRMLETALHRTGAKVLGAQAYWLLRPNDESRFEEPNRAVALQMARDWVLRTAPAALRVAPGQDPESVGITSSPRS